MGILLLLVVFGYLALAAVLLGITVKFAKSKVFVILVAVLLVLFPLRRLIFFETLFLFYRLSPLQEIHETVESPISVYWEDNVWPGYDERGRAWMVKTYLDGKHLQALALNGDDGKVYLYHASPENFQGGKKLLPALEDKQKKIDALHEKAAKIYHEGGNNRWLGDVINKAQVDMRPIAKAYKDQRDKETLFIMARAKVYSSVKGLPSMNYKIEFNPVETLPPPFHKLLHGDRITIKNNKQDKVIAFSRRYLAYAGFMSKISGEQPKFDYRLGDFWSYEFDDKVLFEFARTNRAGSECQSSYLSKRYDRRW